MGSKAHREILKEATMPNWCTNSIEIGHKDRDILAAMTKKMRDCGICQAVIPLEEWSYDEALTKWGTKWELSVDDEVQFDGDEHWTEDIWENGDNHWIGTFANSAWGPPVEVYTALVEQGFSVKAWWWEPGCEVIGQFQTTDGMAVIDEWDDIRDFNANKDRDHVDSELVNFIEEDMWIFSDDLHEDQEIN
jgi:hypothetical protein